MGKVQLSKQLHFYTLCEKKVARQRRCEGKAEQSTQSLGIHVGLHPRDTSPGGTMLPLALLYTGSVSGLHSWV